MHVALFRLPIYILPVYLLSIYLSIYLSPPIYLFTYLLSRLSRFVLEYFLSTFFAPISHLIDRDTIVELHYR